MNATVTIAPVRKSIRVRASQAHAFEVFTARLHTWWPTNHGIITAISRNVFEPKLGGRWYQESETGEQATVGRVLVWQPPERFVISWDINSQWKPDTKISSEVEVIFSADGAETRVDLEHRKFEVMGPEGGEKMRNDVNGGWPGLLDLFKKAAEG